MHMLKCSGIRLPEIYVCRDRYEARQVIKAGIPCVITQMRDIDIIKIILYRTLKKKFPHIKWDDVLKINRKNTINVIVGSTNDTSKEDIDEDDDTCDPVYDDVNIDIRETGDEETVEKTDRDGSVASSEYRSMSGSMDGDDIKVEKIDISDYCADESAHVNIEQLQSLGLLPKFMDDAIDAIRINLESRMRWHECYNKRLGECVGDVSYGDIARNLIILDVSYSIPEGISATMLQLIATLREQAEADLIVTGGRSLFFPREDELPDPEWLRGAVPRSNERNMFLKILETKVAGRHYGNVISFGDNDTPFSWDPVQDVSKLNMSGTVIDRVMHYHTWSAVETGYARWCKIVSPGCEQVFDTSWCRVMYR